MGLLEKVKAGAEQAVSSGQRQAHIMQTKRELSHAYTELGKTAYDLVDRGEVGHLDLTAGADRIRELQTRLAHHHSAAADAATADGGQAADGAGAAESHSDGGEAVDGDIVG